MAVGKVMCVHCVTEMIRQIEQHRLTLNHLVDLYRPGHLDIWTDLNKVLFWREFFQRFSSSEGEGEKESAKYMNILMNKYRCGLQNTIAFRKDIKRGI